MKLKLATNARTKKNGVSIVTKKIYGGTVKAVSVTGARMKLKLATNARTKKNGVSMVTKKKEEETRIAIFTVRIL